MGRAQKTFTVDPAKHVGLVHVIANKFAKRYGGDVQDLVGEGKIGLCIAAQKFEPERGIKFATYASWWISAEIQRYIDKEAQSLHTPIRAARAMREAGRLAPRPASLDANYANPKKVRGMETLHELIADENSPDPEDETATEERKALLWEAVAQLSERQRAVIKQRFIWGKTLAEIGETFGVSRERVRQIEEEALGILKETVKL